MRIFGHLSCHNEWPDVLRAIESLYPFCDEILVTYNGKPESEMKKFLEERKVFYKMTVWDLPFESVLQQRQFLLDKTPKNNWVASLDADEKYSNMVMFSMRDYLNHVDSAIYTDKARKLPIVVPIPCHGLVGDILHYDGSPIYHNMKIFYYDRDLRFYASAPGDFFVHVSYESLRGEAICLQLKPIKGFAILHYARFNPQRLAWRKKHIKDKKYGNYKKNAWMEDIKGIFELPGECY